MRGMSGIGISPSMSEGAGAESCVCLEPRENISLTRLEMLACMVKYSGVEQSSPSEMHSTI